MERAVFALVAAASLGCSRALLLQLPSDVGNGDGAKHPCVVVMRETQEACHEFPYGSSGSDCNFAVCYTADLNRDRCTDVVTTGTPMNVLFGDDLDKVKNFHDIKCEDGGQGGEGIRNARFDCGSADADGSSLLQQSSRLSASQLDQFAARFPISAESSGLKKCLKK
mmetsp:Transcript_34229/g.78036  ORF Transcript_34229/g.78036 Transcript_34229/m.78036 type:complete len:167 (+) Transcript_34229:33-533(+)